MNYEFEICYALYNNADVTQRDIARITKLSLGKVNNLISELVDKGLLVQDKSYTLSKEGMNYLESNKVDNAIIMAAGFGSRFVPMTYDTPKGLLEVHGEVMIERQIKQLHEVGIEDITVIVGYLKEKFEYLIPKYGVKLVYNKDYSTKNNISSLYYTKDILKNSYILTSDIYMTENIYRKYEAYSYYTAEYFENYSNEWALEVNRDGLIQSVDPRGGQGVWTMYGPAFFKEDFSKKLSELIDSYYDKPYANQWYWEDVYVRHIDQLDMYIRKLDSNTVLEFESIEELRVYDTSYLTSSRSDILDTIADVFTVNQEEIVNIKTLKEGMTNDSFLFEVNDTKYVFRAPGKGTDKLINRAQESAVYDLVLPTKISDKVIYISPFNGYKITKFVHNSRNMDAFNQEELVEAMTLLKKFHNLGIKVDHDFDIFERMDYYLEICRESDAILFKDFEDVKALIMEVKDLVLSIDRPKALSHIDSVPDNFLKSEKGMILLDWEYAGMADPIIDLSMFVVYAGFTQEQALNLLRTYLGRDENKEELTLFYAYIASAGYLWSLWTQFKQASGEDFGTYGMDQYSYARNYSRKALDTWKA